MRWRVIYRAKLLQWMILLSPVFLSDAAQAEDPEDSAEYRSFKAAEERADFEDALERAEALRDRFPESAIGWASMGLAHHKLDNQVKAVDCYRRAIAIDPKLASLHYHLGDALSKIRDRYPDAFASYRRAIELDPDDADAHHKLGGALHNYGTWEQAIEPLQRAVELDPNSAKAHYDLGCALFSSQRHEEAIEPVRRAIKLDPERAWAYHLLGSSLNSLGKPEEAIEPLQRAIEIDPEYVSAMVNLSIAHAKSGQVDRGGIWTARWGLEKGGKDEAELVARIRQSFLSMKVEIPADTPSEKAIQEYYRAHPAEFSDATVHLRMISGRKPGTGEDEFYRGFNLPDFSIGRDDSASRLVDFSEDRPAETRESMETLRKELSSGGDFAAAALDRSDDSAASKGGDRGWVKPGDLREDLEKIAFSLKAGEFSEVIEDDTHFRLFNVVERREGTPPPLSGIRGQVVEKIKEEPRTIRIKEWIRQARKELAESKGKN